MPKAIIIGAGIAGIATAIRLAARGYQVQVFEANNYPGGKLWQIAQNGYRFDAGPSLFTMPQYVNELFELAGKIPSGEFVYQQLDVLCQYFYEDGTKIAAYADDEKFAAEIAANTTDTAAAVIKYFSNSSAIYGITSHVFLQRSLHRLSTYFRWDTLRSVLRLPRIDAFRTMHRANQSFFNDPRTIQLFDRYATYNGSNPYQAPATLNVIPHLEQHYGACFPTGGMYSIVTSLVKLAEELGVKFCYNSPVDEIVLSGKKAAGVLVKGQFEPAGIIISNMDVWFTYKRLLAAHPKLQPKRILRQQRSSSALIFYWGITKPFPQLNLHNIFFSAGYRQEFEAIWQHHTISPDPTIYLNISARLNPADAPTGCENWFVMINAPANTGQHWDTLIADARRHIISKLSRILGQDIRPLINSESVLDPRGIETNTSAYQGSLYGNSSNSRLAAFLRHANRSSQITNLYFCGGSVHPGGGIPLALLSAKIVADWIG